LRLVPAADVILCDAHFPVGRRVGLDPEVTRRPWLSLWALARPKPFALMTGDPLAGAEAQAYGIPAFLKPFRIQAVLEFLAGAFGRKAGSQ